MHVARRVHPLIVGAILALTPAAALAQRVAVEVFDVSAYRTLRTGGSEVGRTGVLAHVEPAGEAFVVVEAHVDNPLPKTGEKGQWIRSDEITLRIGDHDGNPIGELNTSNMFRFFSWRIGIPSLQPGGSRHIRLVFGPTEINDSPWTLRVRDVDVSVSRPERIEEAPPTLAQLLHTEVLSVKRVRSYAFGAGPRSLHRVEYENPHGVILTAEVEVRVREEARERSCGCSTTPQLKTDAIGLWDPDRSLHIPLFRYESKQGGSQNLRPGQGTLHMSIGSHRSYGVFLLFAVPESLQRFDILIQGEPVASGLARE